VSFPGPLPPPPGDFSRFELPLRQISGSWFRSHLVDRSPIYYGRNGRYRFDDPDRSYGVLYVADDAHGAFVETFGQFLSAPQRERQVTSEQLSLRALSELICDRPLRLVDLTSGGLARLNIDSRIFAGDYKEAQMWSRAFERHPEKPDGLLYPARHDPARKAAAIFNESLRWTTLSRKTWLSLGFLLRDILNEYGFALIESHFVQPAVRKGPQQETLF